MGRFLGRRLYRYGQCMGATQRNGHPADFNRDRIPPDEDPAMGKLQDRPRIHPQSAQSPAFSGVEAIPGYRGDANGCANAAIGQGIGSERARGQ